MISAINVEKFFARKGIKLSINVHRKFVLSAVKYHGWTDKQGVVHDAKYTSVSFRSDGMSLHWNSASPEEVLVC